MFNSLFVVGFGGLVFLGVAIYFLLSSGVKRDDVVAGPAGLSRKGREELDDAGRIFKLADWLPYKLYDDRAKTYINNDGSVGAIFELVPRLVAADPTPFESLIDMLPESAFMQITLYGSPNVTGIVDNYKSACAAANATDPQTGEYLFPMYKSIMDEYSAWLEKKTRESVNPVMVTKIKNYRMFISILFTKPEDVNIENVVGSFKNILESKKFDPVPVPPQELLNYLFEIFNLNHDFRNIPLYNPKSYLSAQVLAPDTMVEVFDDCIKSDGMYWGSLVPVDYPEETHLYEFGKKLGDYLSMNIDKQQFYDPFIVTANLNRLSKTEIANKRKNGMIVVTQKADERVFPRLAKKQADLVPAMDKYDSKLPVVDYSLGIFVSARNRENLKRNMDNIATYWGSGSKEERFKLMPLKYIVGRDFLGNLPFCYETEFRKLKRNDMVWFSDEAAHFMPAEADWGGTRTATIPVISRRGQLVGFDLFDSPSNFNGYIVATSGAGKSVWINFLTINYLLRGDRVFTFDIGRSYEKLAKTIDGQWIEFNMNSPMSLNPFSEIKTEEDLHEYLDYLIGFVYFMGAPVSQSLSEEIEKFIRAELNIMLPKLWNTNREKLEISHISDEFMGQDDIRFKDFGQQLIPYTRKGLYGKFFNGPSQVSFNKQFVVMELDTLENIPELRDVVMMIMMFHISRSIYLSGISSQKTLVFIDEAHKFLGTSAKIDIFIEQAYRRFRKHEASILIATQGFDDIYSVKEKSLSRAGRVILNSSAWKFFLEQNLESIKALKDSAALVLNQMDEKIIESVRNYKPHHSEVFIMTPFRLNVATRCVIDRFMYYLFTTSTPDKLKIKNYTDKGLSIEQAIKAVVGDDESADEKI